MGGQIRIDNSPYIFFYPCPFLAQIIVTSGILAMEFGEHWSSEKESEFFEGRA